MANKLGQIIKRFKNGEFNILVSTSIGEEGLDIGSVDVIVCYDASKAPVRMVSVIIIISGRLETND